MSAQKNILDAMETALATVAGVNLVTQDLTAWSNVNTGDYSAIFINPRKPTVERLAYLHPTSFDMSARMEVIIEGTCTADYPEDIPAKLDTLMADVEKKLTGDSTVQSLVVDIQLESDEFISDEIGLFGIFSAVYSVDYFYNHLAP